MPTTDYRQGFRDGWSDGREQGRLERASLDGPDGTMYEFIGGPRHGERIATGGLTVFRVPMYEPLRFGYDTRIRVAHYTKRLSSRGVTIYTYDGTE